MRKLHDAEDVSYTLETTPLLMGLLTFSNLKVSMSHKSLRIISRDAMFFVHLEYGHFHAVVLFENDPRRGCGQNQIYPIVLGQNYVMLKPSIKRAPRTVFRP